VLDGAVGEEERARQGPGAYLEFDEGAGAFDGGEAKLSEIGVFVVFGGAADCGAGASDGGCMR
jgi:hypothetical protein